jgi:hypothetical protein
VTASSRPVGAVFELRLPLEQARMGETAEPAEDGVVAGADPASIAV